MTIVRHDLPSLTALRFLAAFSILFAHARLGMPDWFGYATFLGMPLFFVLSGFVIHYNYGALFAEAPIGSALRRFAVARLARIYPLFLAVLAFYLYHEHLFDVWRGAGMVELLAPAYLLNVFSWFPIWVDGKLLIHHPFGLAWSISTEWFFYMVYPLFAAALARSSIRAVAIMMIAVAASTYYLQSVIALHPAVGDFVRSIDPKPPYSADGLVRWFYYVSPYSRISEFLLGGLTAQLFLRWQVTPPRYIVAAAWFIAAAAFMALCLAIATGSPLLTVVRHLHQNFGLAPFLAALIFVLAARDRAGTVAWPTTLILLGEASYSLYLTHPIVLNWADAAGFPSPFLRFPAVLIVAILLSLLTYALIEIPGRRLIRRLGAVN